MQWSQVSGERLLVITQDQNRFTLLPEDAMRLITLLEQAFAADQVGAAQHNSQPPAVSDFFGI